MKEKRKINALQKIISRLRVENQQLLDENKRLKEKLHLEQTDLLENELRSCIEEYMQSIEDMQKVKQKYKDKIAELKQIKKRYNEEMKTIVKSIKKGI